MLGIAFFWITDPRYGLALRWNRGENPIDLANQHFPGTVVGLAGLGCVAFAVSAVAAFVAPATGDEVAANLSNITTALGALGFLVGALLLLPESGTVVESPSPGQP